MKYNCGITGHSGILGSEFIKSKFGKKFIKFEGNITNRRDIKKWLTKNDISYIFHFAAVVPTRVVDKNLSYASKVNYIGTKYLVDEVLKFKKVKWFFFASTSHVYAFSNKKISENKKTEPISKYGLTKLKAEKYVKKKFKSRKIPYCIGRIFSFTHKNQSEDFVIPAIIKKIKNKKKLFFNNTNHYRDFVSTKDILEAIKVLFRNKSVGIYNIGSGKKVLISDIIRIISKKFKKSFLTRNNSKQTCLVADIRKIKKLNWKPSKNINSIINELN